MIAICKVMVTQIKTMSQFNWVMVFFRYTIAFLMCYHVIKYHIIPRDLLADRYLVSDFEFFYIGINTYKIKGLL